MTETIGVKGIYVAICRDASGQPLWSEVFGNMVMFSGIDVALDAYLSGAPYTVNGPYLGLISAAGFVAVASSDTMASHPGWTEAGAAHQPTYSGVRLTPTWAPAANGLKAMPGPVTYTFTGAGTVQGVFLVYGSGATSAIDSTGGALYSAGSFATPQPVVPTNTLEVTYAAQMLPA